MDDHAAHGHDTVLDLDAEVFGAQLGEILDAVLASTARRTPLHVVDLGAGTGTGTRLLRERFPDARVTAVDNSPEMLERLRHGAFDVHRADLDDGFPALGAVDLVWAASSLHHVADPASLLVGVREALTPNGVLVVVELDGLPRFLAGPGDEDEAHAAAAAAGWNHHPDWTPVLRGAGFTVTRTSVVGTAADTPSARRYAQAWFDRFRAGFDLTLAVPATVAPRVTRTVWVATPEQEIS
jgi:SAM-dependent methyltransferase